MSIAQRRNQRLRHWRIHAAPTRHDYRACRRQQVQTPIRGDLHAPGRPQRTRIGAGHGKAIPISAQLRPRETEDLDRTSELECAKPVIRDHYNHGICEPAGDGSALA